MGMVGDVVFCVDCDLARSAHLSVAAGAETGAAEAFPRRMATKRDANRDALCAACLDARLRRRQTAFAQHKDAGTTPASEPVFSPTPTRAEPPVRKASANRVVRVRPSPEAVPTRSEKRAAPPSAPEKRRAVAGQAQAQARLALAHDRKLERRLMHVAVELGFLRAHQLLGELKARALATTKRAR